MLKLLISLCLTLNCISLLASESKKIQEVIPATMSNLKGHQFLYNEGWYVVTSTKMAIEYAHQKMLRESGQKLGEIGASAVHRAGELKKSIKENASSAVQFARDYHGQGKTMGKNVQQSGKELSKAQFERSKKEFHESFERFTLGYIKLSTQTKSDWEELKTYHSQFASFIKKDFSNLKEWLDSQGVDLSSRAEFSWGKSFSKAGAEFNKEYEKSGNEKNSLAALPHLLWGYCKAIYFGIIKPSEESALEGGKTIAKGLAYSLVGPILVANRSFLSLGKNFLFVGKTFIRVVSPTIEGGFLTSLALFNGASAPFIRGGSEGFYAVNQVVVTSTTPLVGGGNFAISTVGDAVKQTALLTYDIGKGASELIVNQTEAAIVLGYNALTALPTQTVLGAGNTLLFLSWDGPRLAIYTLKGEIDYSAPAGLVLDRKKLESDQRLKVEKINDDPETIQKILQKIPEDLREQK